MLTKILFTAAVIVIVFMYAGGKARARSGPETPSRNALPRAAAGSSAAPSSRANPARILAYAFLAVMLLGSGAFLFLEWQDQYRVVSVRVINTNNGRSETFQARRGDVEDRAFETLDGRRVVLSDVERLELGPASEDDRQ